jgi:nucleoside-diphosphate-sugar epimerase
MMASRIPKGSIVLVTVVNGYVGSHKADQLLEAGYQVRGTCGSVSKAQGLISDLWEQKYREGNFELATVTDMSKEGAFDEAVKGTTQLLRKNVID